MCVYTIKSKYSKNQSKFFNFLFIAIVGVVSDARVSHRVIMTRF